MRTQVTDETKVVDRLIRLPELFCSEHRQLAQIFKGFVKKAASSLNPRIRVGQPEHKN